jgi:hypothetical protein
MSKAKLKVRLCIDEWGCDTRSMKKYGFHYTDASLRKMKNGWLEAVVNWGADKDSYLFKTCYNAGRLLCTDYVNQQLRFDNLPKSFKFSIDIGLQLINPTKGEIQYTPEYFVNLKYGVAVYFSPNGWQSGSKLIEEHINIERDNQVQGKKRG